MKVVIWGFGYRGKTLVDYLRNQYVAAIIESDSSKIGQEYKGISVISFDEYLERYQKLPIIITPAYQFQKEIRQQLIEHHIFHFAFCSELPANIRYNGKLDLDSYLDMVGKSEIIYLYGINAFSIILYFLLLKNAKQVIFITEKNRMEENQEAIINLLKFHVVNMELLENNNEPIYITKRANILELCKIFAGRHIIDAFRYADSRDSYRNLELKRFHDLYRTRQRCFIVATGSSLTITDLDTLLDNQEFCLSVNTMCKTETRWKPDVYVVLDGKFFLENQKAIRNYHSPVKILPDDNIEFWKHKREGEYQIHRDTLNIYGDIEFSEDITRIVNSQGTVVVGCIQIAVYMGFKEIYLLGTDCNYTMGSYDNHFGGDDKPDLIDHSISVMEKGYRMCRDYADEHGIKIRNATRGGKLEVFERVDFDSLFEHKEG